MLIRVGAIEENLYGIDIIPDRIEAIKLALPNVKLNVMDARKLEYPDNFFDVVSTFGMFTSVLSSDIKREIAKEMYRVIKPGGAIIYYDFRYNNPRNKNVKGIKLSEIKLLFPDMEMVIKLITVIPPLARKLGKMTSIIYPVLAKFGVLRSHYLGLLFKKVNS